MSQKVSKNLEREIYKIRHLVAKATSNHIYPIHSIHKSSGFLSNVHNRPTCQGSIFESFEVTTNEVFL